MASAIIHLAVAKELEKYLHPKILKDYYLGSIAPDIAKQIGTSRKNSHFQTNTKNNLPNITLFIRKYPHFKHNSFDLGYFIHLYTDKLWFDGFIDQLTINNSIKLLDGTIINTTKEEIQHIIYSDYTNLNIKLIEKYNMDLSLFYEDFKIPKTIINEIPVEKLNILIDKMGIIIENSKDVKPYTFDLYSVENFINNTVNIILEELKKY